LTFDGLPTTRHVDFAEDGRWWIVRSPRISIQGLYEGMRLQSGRFLPAWTKEVTVGGDFLEGHTLTFRPGAAGEGDVTWDGAAILQGQELEVSLGSGLVQAKKRNDPVGAWERLSGVRISNHLQQRMGYTVRSIDVSLPLGVEMTVNIGGSSGANFLDLIIAMHPEPEGQSGHCGNFNGDPSDDTSAMMMGMRSSGVQTGQLSLLSAAAGDAEEAACSAEASANATAICGALCGGGALASPFVEGCVYDVCRGGPELAISDCLVAWQTQVAVAPAPMPAD